MSAQPISKSSAPTALSDGKIRRVYRMLAKCHRDHLDSQGVKLPALEARGGYTKDALVLVYLAKDWPNTRPVSKSELTRFVRLHYPAVNDVQQARHLGAQSGWWILAGGRDNIVRNLKRGWYQLHSLESPYPGFIAGRHGAKGGFDALKAKYQRRCATCGSMEGRPHRYWPGTKTVLQRAHMDPAKPAKSGNVIPQCQKCNRADTNKWVYDRRGRVIAAASCRAVRKSSPRVQREILDWLRGRLKR